MASLRRLVIPTALSVTVLGAGFVACERGSDEGDDVTIDPLPAEIDAAAPDDAIATSDAGTAADAPLPDAPPDAPVG